MLWLFAGVAWGLSAPVVPHRERWAERYKALVAYEASHGHCWPSDAKLSRWIRAQREKYRNGKLSAERVELLESLGVSWSDRFWARNMRRLEAYKKVHGDCCVPPRYVGPDGARLGLWVSRTRRRELSPGKVAELDALGFEWSAKRWEKYFALLCRFREERGDFSIGQDEVFEGERLGVWVIRQRQGKGVTPERRAKLDEIGFPWNAREARWNDKFDALRSFVAANGHARVPRRHVTQDGVNLGTWATNQRFLRRRGRLSQDRVHKLDQLDFVWEPSSSEGK
ncbi:hypothetical protein CTAYLR_003318 [Chrysophaeum taylorii]|uniref:Helicase-associated domain-containing protein n=1 Tax=Chrysophaeum taylorii TaxID=2483200 RepID=A0AAD7XM34_9STRA|nr:hypothetical protein CTAYLR_003318 [Chrysophaeum taylorii]